jgi:hypothetical protein
MMMFWGSCCTQFSDWLTPTILPNTVVATDRDNPTWPDGWEGEPEQSGSPPVPLTSS